MSHKLNYPILILEWSEDDMSEQSGDPDPRDRGKSCWSMVSIPWAMLSYSP